MYTRFYSCACELCNFFSESFGNFMFRLETVSLQISIYKHWNTRAIHTRFNRMHEPVWLVVMQLFAEIGRF